MKRLVLPFVAVGILAACGSSNNDNDVADAPAATPITAAPPVSSPVSSSSSPVTSSSSPVSSSSPGSVPTDGGVVDVPDALEFSAPLVGGGEIELGALAGRPVLLWFWAPW